MSVWSVYLPPDAESEEAAEGMRLVPDGFSFAALAFPFLWCLAHGMLLIALAWLGLKAALIVAAPTVGWGASLLTIALLHLAMGLEAAGLRRFHLRRKGWREVGAVWGGSEEAASLRALHELVALDAPVAAPASRVPAAPPVRRPWLAEPRVIGLDHR